MTARSLVIGLDGADLGLVRELGPARLPVLHGLMERGAYAALESVTPPATLPNWTTFLTGADPGTHGVFDFTTRRGYQVRFTAGTVRAVPTIAARLDARGLACACLGFPATWPPEPLRHGVFMSGWDAPVAFEADRSFVHPPELFDRIEAKFGTPSFDDVDEFASDADGFHARLGARLAERIAKKTELSRWLLEERTWDLFLVYFGESDTASHHLASLHDPRSPRRPAHVSPDEAGGLGLVYEALDRAVGELVATAGEGVEITIVSDHGSGGASDKVLHLNRALEAAGLLAFRDKNSSGLMRAAKDLALRRLPPRVREKLFRSAGALLPSLLESRARFSAIDMARTRAFSDELNYFPAVHLNLRRREPRGIVDEHERREVSREVERALLALRDPWTGGRVVRAVVPREALFVGPHVDRAPDLIVELELDSGYSYNLMPSGDGVFRRLGADEHLGRKGRSLPGSHRPRGLYVAAGPRVQASGEIDAKIADATATLLARMDVESDGSGRVLREILARDWTSWRASPLDAPNRKSREASPWVSPSPQDERRVADRLRALGYID